MKAEYRLAVSKHGLVRYYPKRDLGKAIEGVEHSFRDFLRAPAGVEGELDAWYEMREVSEWASPPQ